MTKSTSYKLKSHFYNYTIQTFHGTLLLYFLLAGINQNLGIKAQILFGLGNILLYYLLHALLKVPIINYISENDKFKTYDEWVDTYYQKFQKSILRKLWFIVAIFINLSNITYLIQLYIDMTL